MMTDPKQYTIGWICAVTCEFVAAQAFLDETHDYCRDSEGDSNTYALGKIGEHNVVIAALPLGLYGLTSAATVAKDLVRSFPNVRIGLMVGIAGGAPSAKHDIRLGDVVVSRRSYNSSGVIQYDNGRQIQEQGFAQQGTLNSTPTALATTVAGLEAHHELRGHELYHSIEKALKKIRKRKAYAHPPLSSDRLYRSDVVHSSDATGSCAEVCGEGPSLLVQREPRDEDDDYPVIHYGPIASANALMKDAHMRDALAAENNILCFEMEAAGLMNHFPCLVIRGICDYSDTHKNDEWQGFAAMAAAAYATELLHNMQAHEVEAKKSLADALSTC